MSKMRILCAQTPNGDYVKWLQKMYGEENVEILKYKSGKLYLDVNFILLTGGADVEPHYYGQETGKYTSTNPRRDEVEMEMCKSNMHLPKLGICRGSQFLTVLSGGKLIQHVSGHGIGGVHNIQTDFKMPEGHFMNYPISSTHHQMMYPYNLKKGRYQLIAWSEYFLSDTYLNGNNEEMLLKDDFLEPEIVYYENTNALAIQGHPEYSFVPEETVEFCKSLIDNFLLRKNGNN